MFHALVVWPNPYRKTWALFEAGRKRQIEQLFGLQKEFHDMLYDVLGSVLSEGRIDGAYDKMLVRLGGLEEMPLRLLTYQCFTEAQYQACKRVLQEKYADWLL